MAYFNFCVALICYELLSGIILLGLWNMNHKLSCLEGWFQLWGSDGRDIAFPVSPTLSGTAYSVAEYSGVFRLSLGGIGSVGLHEWVCSPKASYCPINMFITTPVCCTWYLLVRRFFLMILPFNVSLASCLVTLTLWSCSASVSELCLAAIFCHYFWNSLPLPYLHCKNVHSNNSGVLSPGQVRMKPNLFALKPKCMVGWHLVCDICDSMGGSWNEVHGATLHNF